MKSKTSKIIPKTQNTQTKIFANAFKKIFGDAINKQIYTSRLLNY